MKTIYYLFLSLIICLSLWQCEKCEEGSNVPYQLHGLNFSPYMDGQDPNRGVQISEEQLRNRMADVAPYTRWIRTFGSTHGLEKSGEIAHSMGLKAAVGAWLGRNINTNEQEIANLITAANAGHVDMAIVGSEVLLRNDLSVSQLIGYIHQVRNAIPSSIPVTTADICANLLSHPDLISAVDVIFFNQYPYWEGTPLECGAASLHSCYQELKAVAKGKPIVLSETGWPSCGNEIGNAVPSPENASWYFLNVVSWAKANDVPMFYFEAYDELWKAGHEGPQGACWGIWDKDGHLKPGMQAVFDGQTMADNWSGNIIPGGAGTPEIEFTFVPEIGSHDNLKGQVWHVLPSEHKVAVYIMVSGRWWTKPTFAQPLTSIACDGSWTTDITTGGIDSRATKIAAYLVPNGYNPPSAGGSRNLPQELEEKSLAKVEVTRN